MSDDLFRRVQASRGARVAIPVFAALLLVVGLAAPPWAGVPALLVLVLIVGWLALSVPAASTGLVRLRLLVLGVLVALFVGRLVTWIA